MALASINSGGGNWAEKVARTGLPLPVFPLTLAFSALGDFGDLALLLLNNLLKKEFFLSKLLLFSREDGIAPFPLESAFSSSSSGTSLTSSEASFLVNLQKYREIPVVHSYTIKLIVRARHYRRKIIV